MASLLLAAALQSASAPAAQQAEICSLVTPRGDVVHFAAMAWSEDGTRLGLAPIEGSAWPVDAIVGTQRSGGSGKFVFGNAGGIVLELSERVVGRPARSATLFRNEGLGLPLAFGYCQLGPSPEVADAVDAAAQPASVGANVPALDPQNWPDDCGLLLGDGRRLRFAYEDAGNDRIRLSSSDLWPGGPVTATIRRNANVRARVFSRRGGPEGLETTFVAQPLAAVLVRMTQLGAPSAPNQTAYGICGYRGVHPVRDSSVPVVGQRMPSR